MPGRKRQRLTPQFLTGSIELTSIELTHKEEFIKRLAKKHRCSQQFYRDALHEILGDIQEHLAQGKSVHFIGFGSFYTRMRKGGRGYNFKTNKPVDYKAVRQAAFKVGNILKQAVRRKRGLLSR